MIKYGVWFMGNEKEQEGICFDGRKPFICSKVEDAVEYMQVLKYYAGFSANLFKVIKIEVLE